MSKRQAERGIKNLDRLKVIHKKLKSADDQMFELRLKSLEADTIDLVTVVKQYEDHRHLDSARWFIQSSIKEALQEIEDKKDRRAGERREKSKSVQFEDDDE